MYLKKLHKQEIPYSKYDHVTESFVYYLIKSKKTGNSHWQHLSCLSKIISYKGFDLLLNYKTPRGNLYIVTLPYKTIHRPANR